MGVDHGGDRRDRGTSPEFGAGEANANCLPRFCHIGTKMSVLWPSKYAKIRFRPGLCVGPRWGSSRRSPRSLSWLERGHPFPYPTSLGTDPPSALAMRPPRSPARSMPMGMSTWDTGQVRISRSPEQCQGHGRKKVAKACLWHHANDQLWSAIFIGTRQMTPQTDGGLVVGRSGLNKVPTGPTHVPETGARNLRHKFDARFCIVSHTD